MKIKSLASFLMLCGCVMSTSYALADEAPATETKAKKAVQRDRAPGKQRNMRRAPREGMFFDPSMMIMFQVKEELKAYNENKTEENYKKLEAAVKKVSKENIEKRREQLKKQLENLDKDQEKMVGEFLKKAKDGTLKTPVRGPREGKGMFKRGPRDRGKKASAEKE